MHFTLLVCSLSWLFVIPFHLQSILSELRCESFQALEAWMRIVRYKAHLLAISFVVFFFSSIISREKKIENRTTVFSWIIKDYSFRWKIETSSDISMEKVIKCGMRGIKIEYKIDNHASQLSPLYHPSITTSVNLFSFASNYKLREKGHILFLLLPVARWNQVYSTRIILHERPEFLISDCKLNLYELTHTCVLWIIRKNKSNQIN